jgi:hypothetical protein
LPLRLLEESRDQALDPEATALGKSECATLARALERLPARDRDDPLEIRHVTVDLSDRTVLSALRAVQSESGIVLVVSIRRAEKKTRLKVSLPK